MIFIPDEVLIDYAFKLDFRAYNMQRDFHDKVFHDKVHVSSILEFEPLRDFYMQKIILHILNSEFNIKTYMDEGIIKNHFPLH